MIQYHAVTILKLRVKELKGKTSKESNKRNKTNFCLENREIVLVMVNYVYIRNKVLPIHSVN